MDNVVKSDVVLCAACEAFMYVKGTFTLKSENFCLLCLRSQQDPVLDYHPFHIHFGPRWFECELEQAPIP